MDEFDLPFPERDVEAAVDRAVEACGLLVGSKGGLKAYPGCVHWHLKRPGTAGTLEITWWPDAGRLWANVHPRRDAVWISDAIEGLKVELGG